MTHFVPLLELTRCQVVESVHFGAIAVVDAHGRLLASAGDPQMVATLRSSAKPFQAIPFLENDGPSFYQLTERETALICASHSGTDEHVAAVRQIQAKTGVHEDELLCGIHKLSHPATVEAMRQRGEALSPNRNNCSGKHSAMLAHIRLRAARGEKMPDLPYIAPEHPIQAEILSTIAEMCDLPVQQIAVGMDGCSAPTFAMPLFNAALGFARLMDNHRLPPRRAAACRAIVAAMTRHPDMVGGPDSFDTHLMRVMNGRVLSKVGAEGFIALGIPPEAIYPGSPALGVAIKIADGDLTAHSRDASEPGGRARPAVALEALRQLDAIRAEELAALAVFGPGFPVENWRKVRVGEGRVCFELSRNS